MKLDHTKMPSADWRHWRAKMGEVQGKRFTAVNSSLAVQAMNMLEGSLKIDRGADNLLAVLKREVNASAAAGVFYEFTEGTRDFVVRIHAVPLFARYEHALHGRKIFGQYVFEAYDGVGTAQRCIAIFRVAIEGGMLTLGDKGDPLPEVDPEFWVGDNDHSIAASSVRALNANLAWAVQNYRGWVQA